MGSKSQLPSHPLPRLVGQKDSYEIGYNRPCGKRVVWGEDFFNNLV